MSKLTEISIEEVFIKELSEKSFDRITVKSLSAECGINRKTFYNHFRDMDELLDKTLKLGKEKALILLSQYSEMNERLSAFTGFMLKNRRVLENIWNSQGHHFLEDYISNMAETAMFIYVRSKAGESFSTDVVSDLADFYASVLSDTIRQWIRAESVNDLSGRLLMFFKVLNLSVFSTLEELEKSKKATYI